MALKEYRTLGHSGLRVSPFCLGGMTFGEEWGVGTTVEVSQQIIDRFLEAGGNFIDSSNIYTCGHSEKIIGDHIGSKSSRRERVVLATKFFANLHQGDPNSGGAGRKAIFAACEHSLRRLQTDYIDLYLLHCWDKFTPIEETMRALDDLVTAGKVRYLGFSDTPAWKVAQAQMFATFRGWAPLIALQIEYSLLERTVEGDLIPMARDLGLGVTPFAPLKAGLLSGKYNRTNAAHAEPRRGSSLKKALNEQALHVIDVLAQIANERNASIPQVALAWLNTRPGVASIIIGATSLKQLDENIAGLDMSLGLEDVAALNEASRPVLNWPAEALSNIGIFGYGGTTINGETFPVNPRAPTNDFDRY